MTRAHRTCRPIVLVLVPALFWLWVTGGPSASAQVARSARPEAAPVLKADYQFQNNLNSSVAGAPALANTGAGTSTFAVENVDGTQRTVLQFPAGRGLQLANASSVIPRDRYTIAVRMRFDDITSFRRVINFTKNALPDTGVYLLQGRFWYYPLTQGSFDSLADADEWVDVTLTRSSGGLMRGYIDGTQVWEDTYPASGLTNSGNMIRFFRDNDPGVGESSSGAVSRIRLFNKPLTPSQVAAL